MVLAKQNITQWLESILDENRYEPLDDKTKSRIAYSIDNEFHILFPGNYEYVKLVWSDTDHPTLDIKFADQNEYLLFMLKYS